MPIIYADPCGFKQGAKYINKDVTFITNVVDSTVVGFNNPTRGTEIAKSQMNRGVDVIFSSSGNTDYGVIEATNTTQVMAIISGNYRNNVSNIICRSRPWCCCL